MRNVGPQANILKVTPKLKKILLAAGALETFSSGDFLFRVDQQANGIYLVVKGKIQLSLPDLPKLDRVFSGGSLLGLPATFTGHTYSLEAIALTKAEAVHVGRERFLELMAVQSEHCREVADILSREVSFIQGALAERRRQTHPAA